jgi:hypothetical protein
MAATTGLALIVTLVVAVLAQPLLLKLYVTVYVFGVLAARLIVPFETLMLNPAGVAEYVPPVCPILVTVAVLVLQYGFPL